MFVVCWIRTALFSNGMDMRARKLRTAAKRRRKNKNQPSPKAVKARKRAQNKKFRKGQLISGGV